MGIIGTRVTSEALVVLINKSGMHHSNITISDKLSQWFAELVAEHGCKVSNMKEIAPNSQNILLMDKTREMDSRRESVGESVSASQKFISFAAD